MDKILVIETGGTFATESIDSYRHLRQGAHSHLYENSNVQQKLQTYGCQLEIIRPIYTLSENMTIEKLNVLIMSLWNIDFKKYKGIIISHGTDTMAYTANLLSMVFSASRIPIAMVSSNHPIDMEQSNGLDNFLSSIDFIQKSGLKGIYVIYKNSKGSIEVHMGSRIKQMNQITDTYESFKNLIFGEIKDGEFYISKNPFNPTREDILEKSKGHNFRPFSLKKKIMLIHPYVGLKYDFFNIKDDIDAIVCGVYHSGTLCSEDSSFDQSINNLITVAGKRNIPIFLGELSSKEDDYASFTGIIPSPWLHPVYDISLENLYIKAHIGFSAYENLEDSLKFIKEKNLFFERII